MTTSSTLPNDSSPPGKALFLIAALVFTFALGLRLWQITEPAPQPDEILWTSRSAKVLNNAKLLKEKGIAGYSKEFGYLNITAHLPHPGLIPATVMAASQLIAERINQTRNFTPQSDGYIDRLNASRVGVAIISALICPLMLIGLTPLMGFWPSLMAALLLSVDPRHLLISRMAHLDSILSFFVLATLLVYLQSVQRKSFKLKTLAGFLWGCCLLIKPTSLVLIPCFMIYKALRSMLIAKENDSGERTVVAWCDIWAIIVAHLTFSLAYTRLWIHRSEYRVRMQIRALAAKYTWRLGKYLHAHLYVSIPIIVALSSLAAYFLIRYRKTRVAWQRHLGLALLLISSLVTGLTCFPQVFENLARYWAWVLGLSGTKHDSFGKVVGPTSHGYIDLLLTEVPTLILLGLIPGILMVLLRLKSKQRREHDIALVTLLILPLLWLAILSISPKQTWRYAVPIVPCIYAVAAYGFYECFQYLVQLFPADYCRKRPALIVNTTFLPLLVVIQLLPFYRLTPEHHLYFNSLSGGLEGALSRQAGIPFSGQNQIVQFLMQAAQSRSSKSPLFVTVFGSETTLKRTATRLYGATAAKKISFGYYPQQMSDYLVTFDTHPHLIHQNSWEATFSRKPAYQYIHEGLPLASVYKTSYTSFDTPFIISVRNSHRNTGHLIRSKVTRKNAIQATPGKDDKGYLLFTPGVRFPEGSFTIKFAVLVEDIETGQKASDPTVLHLELGDCRHNLTAEQITAIRDEDYRVSLSCPIAKAGRYSPNIYWHGSLPVSIGSIFIQRAVS